MDRIKKWLSGKRKRENMIVLALSGILLMVIALPAGTKQENAATKSVQTDSESAMLEKTKENAAKEDELEERLTELLACMDGVGKVKVMITYSSTPQQVVEKDIPVSDSRTQETDSAGGSRSVQSSGQQEGTVYTTDEAGNKVPYVSRTLSAQVEGLTVLCEGGASPVVQQNITDIAEALFGIEAHKIKVAKMVIEEKEESRGSRN